MNSNLQYVIFIIFIFALQILFYTNFCQYESGSPFHQAAIEKLKMQNEKLQTELSSLKTQSARKPASVDVKKEPIEMSGFYLSKAKELILAHKADEALTYLDKVKNESLNQIQIPESVYKKVEIQCQKKREELCLSEIDFLVTQYPDSDWTGRALKVLSSYYQKEHRLLEMQSLNNIINQNFSKTSRKINSEKL